jgi:TRAP-type C4-dicarboxylate transport system permease small subunit
LLAAIDRHVDALVTFLERVLAIGLLAAISLSFVNAIGRYLGGYAISGAAEVESYILIWITFLGAAFVTWRGTHLRMDVIVGACAPMVRWLVGLFEMLVMLVVASFVAWHSFKYVERIYALGAVSDIAHIPTFIPHSAIAIGFGAMVLIVILRGLQRIMSPGLPPDATRERAEP